MRGQWLGRYEGSTSGSLMINIDEVDDHFEGVAYMRPDSEGIPGTIVYLRTEDKSDEHSIVAHTYPIDPITSLQTSWNKIQELYPEGTNHSKTAKVQLKLSDSSLRIKGVSDIGVELNALLSRPPETEESKIIGKQMSWAEFKSYVSDMPMSGYLFRGQKKPWKLCTSFHRRGRFRISEFTNKDVKQLHKRLTAITTHFFDLTIADQNGAFFNLLQHHGYPTPLLDWSHSPYVASFFAFRDLPIGYSDDGFVRVYLFNSRDWEKNFNQIPSIDPPFPHLSVMEFIAINNPRLVPQQAVTTATNIYDIEAYILEKQRVLEKNLIEAVDVPAKEREAVMSDLRFMGITAGSMFPSIDGVCEELRERNFDR